MVEVVLGSSVDVEAEDEEVDMAPVTGRELVVDVGEVSCREVPSPGCEVEVGEADALTARAFLSATSVMTGKGLAPALDSCSLRHSKLVRHLLQHKPLGAKSHGPSWPVRAKMIVQLML